ncbi:MAG TPA: TIGR00282 family metallophosphoesterase [Candidatus Saccharimonadales bacterium]|nr:TIGR00282 family metallophosphoesterase [Candidatus Saccharimonadales bacterium]
MNILYIGDIMGEPGIEVVRRVLPEVVAKHKVELIIAQGENVTEGKGLSLKDFKRLEAIGVDFFTGGNWTTHRSELHTYLNDPDRPVIRPANYPIGTIGKGYKYFQTLKGPVLIVSLLGQIVGRDADKPVDNPLITIDKILGDTKHVKSIATIVNFHGDFSSEKRVIGYYLDGRATAVIGDHWHVPTADAMVLPNGTAHITDVGMCGSLNSSLGVKLETIINRWRDGKVSPNQLETEGPFQFNAVLIKSDDQTMLAKSITHIQKIIA